MDSTYSAVYVLISSFTLKPLQVTSKEEDTMKWLKKLVYTGTLWIWYGFLYSQFSTLFTKIDLSIF